MPKYNEKVKYKKTHIEKEFFFSLSCDMRKQPIRHKDNERMTCNDNIDKLKRNTCFCISESL